MLCYVATWKVSRVIITGCKPYSSNTLYGQKFMDTRTFNVLLYQPPRSWFQSFHQTLEHGCRDWLPFTQEHQWGPTLSLGDHIWLSVAVPVHPKGVGSGCRGQGSVQAGQVLPHQTGKPFWTCLCAQGGIVLLKQEMAFRKLLPHFLSMEAGKTAADHYSSSAKLLQTFCGLLTTF